MFKIFEKNNNENCNYETKKIVCMLPNGKLCTIDNGKLKLTNDFIAIPINELIDENIKYSFCTNDQNTFIKIYKVNNHYVANEYSNKYKNINSFYIINDICEFIFEENNKEITKFVRL